MNKISNQKGLLFFSLALIFFSCSTKSDKNLNITEGFSIQMDTVLIDSQNQSLFLNWNLSNASLSSDSRYLFNLNINEPSIEKIDLNLLRFQEKINLEKEGPNGIGNNGRGGIIALTDSLLLFTGYPASIIINTKGEKTDYLKDLIVSKKKFSDLGKDLLYEKVDPNHLNMIYGILVKFPGLEHELGILDLQTNETSQFKLPEWKMLEDYSMICDDPDYYDVYESRIFLKYINNQIILGSNVSSSLYVFDIGQSKLNFHRIDHQLTEPERTFTLPKEVSDPQEFFSLYKKTESEISFGEPVWDAINEWYFRLSYLNFFDASISGYPSPTRVETYLSILDKNFKLISEIQLPTRKSAPGFYLAKDGMLWVFENIEDEMGFIRISIE